MKIVEKWLWRIRWAGRWTTTKIHWTEEEIRRENPEATKVEGSRILVNRAETDAEIEAAQRAPRREYGPDGAIKKMWEQ
jgi:hypothetical protein